MSTKAKFGMPVIKYVYLNDLDRICRLCLSSQDLIELLDTPLLQHFRQVTDIRLPLHDKLPRKICAKCIQSMRELQQITGFIKQCKLAEKVLNDHVQKLELQQNGNVQLYTKNGSQGKKRICKRKTQNKNVPTAKKQNIEFIPVKKEVLVEEFPNGNRLTFDEEAILLEITEPEEKVLVKPKAAKKQSSKNKKQQHDLVKKPQILTEKPVACPYCPEMFALISHRNSHMKRVHSEEMKRDCGIDENIKEGQLKCDICGCIFLSYTSCFIHMKRHNPDERRFKCILCDFKTSYKTVFLSHMKTHGDSVRAEDIEEILNRKKHQCHICSYSTNERGGFVRHMTMHTGEKAHKCNICSKAFRTRANLRVHLLSHQDCRNFQCEYCEQNFKLKVHLKQHQKKHFGQPRFICDFCPAGFSSFQVKRRHQAEIHGAQT